MLHISLFSGVGGFDLASEWMGWKNIASCEINEFGNKVLEYYWPEAYHHRDIHTFTYDTIDHELSKRFGSHWRSEDIILTGGFPCQPYSTAGKRLGKADARHLWPEMCRAIREIQPAWIVGENVRGLISWNGGMVFDEVQAELEAEGYSVLPFVLPACAVNAPHRRDRVFFVAYAKGNGSTSSKLGESESRQQIQTGGNVDGFEGLGDATDTNGVRLEQRKNSGEMGVRQTKICGAGGEFADATQTNGAFSDAADTDSNGVQGFSTYSGTSQNVRQGRQGFEKVRHDRYASGWEGFPTISPIRMRDDGVSNKLLRFVVKEFYDTISYTSQENRIKNLQEVWESIQSEEIWEQIRGFYSLESKNVLFQTVQLYSSEWHQQGELSPFSKELCQPILQHLSKYKEFRCSPQGQELEKQRFIQFGNTLSFLPHEVALAARRFEAAIAKFESWHRQESIKAGGNAVVPQVVLQIFKAIEQYNNL